MRRFAFVGGVMAALVGGAVVLAAASPTPAPSATARPSPAASASAAPHASATPKPTATNAPKASAGSGGTASSFSAQIRPLQITGSATVHELSAGDGTVTLHVTGLLDAVRWTVDIDGGTIARPNEAVEIAFKSGTDVTRLATDAVRIHLTRAEMAAFMNAQKTGGVVAIVSDGSQVGFAEFAAG